MRINNTTLEAQPFLRGMNTRQLELLAENSMLAEFKAGEKILSEGDAANRFYLILEGLVELESRGLEEFDIGEVQQRGKPREEQRDVHEPFHGVTSRSRL